jgi:alpha-beta hydrolase superfamily lysophospholipase
MPVLVLHGTADALIPVADAQRYAQRRQAVGLPTTLHLYEGAPHAFFNWPDSRHARDATHDLLAWLRGAKAD